MISSYLKFFQTNKFRKEYLAVTIVTFSETVYTNDSANLAFTKF